MLATRCALYCCPLHPWPARCCVRRLRATRARAIRLPAACSSRRFFDASLRSMTLQAWRTMLNIIGGDYRKRWPDEESRIIYHTTLFTYTQRISILTFLYGNLRDVDLVYTALLPQFGTHPRDLDHTRRFLADLARGRYDRRYYYFDLLAADWLFLNGEVNTRHAPPTPFARRMRAWERECMRMRREHARWPTLAELHAHFA